MIRPWHAAIILPVVLLPVLAAAEQLIVNPGFEDLKDGKPVGWLHSGEVTGGATAHGGAAGLALGDKGRVWQVFALEPGAAYVGSVWARGAGKLSLCFYEYNQPGVGQGYASTAAAAPVQLADQWRQLHITYSQGAREASFKSIAFAVVRGGEGEVLIDDVVLDKLPNAAPGPNLLPNPAFTDADRDGLPDQWVGQKRRYAVEQAPGGVRVLRVDARLFSEDYLPAPETRDWWSFSRWGDQHGSGWPAMPRPLGGAYTVMVESAPVPVLPGQRYDLTTLLRELQVWGEFTAVRWFNAERKPLAEFEERLGYEYISHGVCQDWQTFTGRTTAPQDARFAAFVIGCKQSSGTLWVARPSLHLAAGAPYMHEPRTERHPADLKQGTPRARTVQSPSVKLGPAPVAGVKTSASALDIAFANGIALRLPLQDGRLVGITSVTYRGWPLRNPNAPPLSPVIETLPRRQHTECVYQSHEPAADGGIVVHSVLKTSAGETDRLDWLLAPVAQKLGGKTRTGLRYGYRFKTDKARVKLIVDRATWEVGGLPMGLQVGGSLHPLSPTGAYCLEFAWRYVGADSFDYQTGRAGTLVSFLDRYNTSLFARAATPDFLLLQDNFHFPGPAEAATTMRNVLFCDSPGGPDDWAAVRDELYARQRQQLGAPPETPLQPACMYIGYTGLRGIGSLKPEDPKILQTPYYEYVADQVVPRVAELGFKRLMMVLPRGPWDWPHDDINHLGPESAAAFKRLCDEARRHGLGMVAWYGSVQNLDKAAVWQEHPEFILRNAQGERSRTYYSPWGWPGKLAAGFHDHTIAGLKDARERTGLAGLWLDSYCSATHLMDTADIAEAVIQADGLLPWHAAIEKLGYYTYCEGEPHGLGAISTGGWTPPADGADFHPEHFYKQGLYLQQPWHKSGRPLEISDMGAFLADPARRHYYRMLAHHCCPIVDMGHFGDDNAAMDRIAQANRDFNAVCDLMQVRRLLGSKGVEWTSPHGRAVFVFEAMDYALPKDLKQVRDVTTGRPVTVSGGKLHLQPYHTYRMTR